MASRLIVPVYLNQRIVFDMLAMLEDGIAHVTRIASVDQASKETDKKFGAEFGLSKALSSLLSIGVSGSFGSRQGSSEEKARSEERIHTPASLFFRLREQLLTDGILRTVEDGYAPRLHDLVEFSASLERNPLIQVMDAFISLTEMAVAFSEKSSSGKTKQGDQRAGNVKALKQMQSFREKLTEDDSVDLVAREIPTGYQAVITLENGYLNDPAMADLADGTFTVVGKITKIVCDGREGISLLRRSALKVMPETLLQGMLASLQQLSVGESFNMPDLDLEIAPPAFQIIPLAIYA